MSKENFKNLVDHTAEIYGLDVDQVLGFTQEIFDMQPLEKKEALQGALMMNGQGVRENGVLTILFHAMQSAARQGVDIANGTEKTVEMAEVLYDKFHGKVEDDETFYEMVTEMGNLID